MVVVGDQGAIAGKKYWVEWRFRVLCLHLRPKCLSIPCLLVDKHWTTKLKGGWNVIQDALAGMDAFVRIKTSAGNNTLDDVERDYALLHIQRGKDEVFNLHNSEGGRHFDLDIGHLIAGLRTVAAEHALMTRFTAGGIPLPSRLKEQSLLHPIADRTPDTHEQTQIEPCSHSSYVRPTTNNTTLFKKRLWNTHCYPMTGAKCALNIARKSSNARKGSRGHETYWVHC